MGVPKPDCFKPGCLQFLRRSALLRPFAPFCALLRPFAPFCALLRTCVCALLRSFCAHLRSFALVCVFSNLVWNDRVWNFRNQPKFLIDRSFPNPPAICGPKVGARGLEPSHQHTCFSPGPDLSFCARMSAGTSAWMSAGYLPQNLLFGLLFRS